MKARIKAVSYYLPEKVLSNSQISSMFPEWSVEKISKKIGISERHVSAEDELASDMAIKAAEKLFSENNIDRSEVDFILFCTQSPDYFLPTSACIIQNRLSLSTNTGALDFNLGCSGYIYGLAMSKGLISSGIAKNVLLLTAETYTKHIHEKDKANITIFGDAAAATLISTEGFAAIGEFDLGSDGSGFGNLIVRNGGLRTRNLSNKTESDEYGNVISPDHLFMNGGAIFNFTADIVPSLVNNILVKNNLFKEDIGLFIFHQANQYMLNHLRKKLEIEEDRFYYFMEKVGNTVSSTIPIALCEAMNERKAQGKQILLAGFGVGYSWGGNIITVE